MQVKTTKRARQHLEAGYHFYEENQAGLGLYFLDSLYTDISSLAFFGGIHSKHFGVYRLIAKKFPFAVYYEIEDNIVFVIAVLDSRRDPHWIKTSLIE